MNPLNHRLNSFYIFQHCVKWEKCLPYYQCSSSNGTILAEYANPDVLHFDENIDFDPCEDILHVCCLVRSEISQPIVTNKTEAPGGSPNHPIVTPMPRMNVRIEDDARSY